MKTIRTPLSADYISATALTLIDRHGLDSLSMRRLGTALGYEAMSIYKHVPDKETLLDLVVSRMYQALPTPDPGAAWDTRLRHIAEQLRIMALAHPHLFIRAVTRPPATPPVTKHIDALLSALRDSGLSEDRAVTAFWLFTNTTSGALLAETTALTGEATVGEFTDQDPAECPALMQYGPALAACDFAAIYAESLDAVLSSITPTPQTRKL